MVLIYQYQLTSLVNIPHFYHTPGTVDDGVVGCNIMWARTNTCCCVSASSHGVRGKPEILIKKVRAWKLWRIRKGRVFETDRKYRIKRQCLGNITFVCCTWRIFTTDFVKLSGQSKSDLANVNYWPKKRNLFLSECVLYVSV